MNKLLKQIKENNEEFENQTPGSIWGNGKTLKEILSQNGLIAWYDYIQSHIIKAKIKELEVLAEMMEKDVQNVRELPETLDKNVKKSVADFTEGYNKARDKYLQILKTTIKELKTN